MAQLKKDEVTAPDDDAIILSNYTKALIESLDSIPRRTLPDDYTRITVSRAVSFLAIVYEKVRNAIEYQEDHLIRRSAIERILKRRLGMNPTGDGEGENLVRELLWARYFPKNSLGEIDVEKTQEILDTYLDFQKAITKTLKGEKLVYANGFLFDMLTCQIEEALSPEIAARESMYTFYIYQTLHQTVKIADIPTDQKDAYFFVAVEKVYRKSDRAYQRAHLYNLIQPSLMDIPKDKREPFATKLEQVFERIDALRTSKSTEKLAKFVKRQLPAYLIFFELLNTYPKDRTKMVTDKNLLEERVTDMCTKKYAEIKQKLTIMAVRSLIYIIITKMTLAIVLEYPVSMLLYKEAPLLPIIINGIFPPLLMLMIVLWFRLPGKDNTERILERIVEMTNNDPTFETRVALIARKEKEKTRVLSSLFMVFYIATFGITISLIFWVLSLLDFHLLSKLLFLFFISVVSYFAYRIKQVVNEYRLIERDSILSPVVDFFFMPILSLGKLFNLGVSRINFFTVIFDVLIEAPFKLIIDLMEEWTRFVKARKEEIF